MELCFKFTTTYFVNTLLCLQKSLILSICQLLLFIAVHLQHISCNVEDIHMWNVYVGSNELESYCRKQYAETCINTYTIIDFLFLFYHVCICATIWRTMMNDD